MEYKYLYVDEHNGHQKTYHPFITHKQLSQEMATELLIHLPGAERMGTDVADLMIELDKKKYEVDYYICNCCGQECTQILSPNLSRWNLIYGICGNY